MAKESHLTQIAVNDVLDRKVGGAEGELVTATDGGMIIAKGGILGLSLARAVGPTQMHFKVREEVNVLTRYEGLERTDAAEERPI